MSIKYLVTVAFIAIAGISCQPKDGSPGLNEKEGASSEEAISSVAEAGLHSQTATTEITGHTPGEEGEEDHEHEEGLPEHTEYIVSKKPFHAVYKTSGMIMVDTKDEISITAKSPGIVRFEDHFLYPGVPVEKGTRLFSITGDDLTENNTSVNFTRAESEYLTAKSNLERAEKLIREKLITEEHYLEIKNEFNKAEAEYMAFGKSSGKEGSQILSPEKGYILEVYITEGESVVPGQELAKIIIEHNMVLKAEVSPSRMDFIETVSGARFSSGYSNMIYSTGDMHGHTISYGRSTGENSFYIPVYIRFDFDRNLIPGTFVDVWLLGKEIPEAVVIPNSAVLEDFGKYYVILETREGTFENHYFTPGFTDGEYTQVLEGLNVGDVIISEGAYQVKMSMMTGVPPAHNHNH